jgi:hypothetical protein
MQVDEVRAWGGVYDWIPEEFRGKPGPFEVSEGMLDELSKIFDVAIMNHRQQQPSKRERGRGAKPIPPRRVLWIDVLGGGFKQR